jgi:hypothetical protein
MIINITEFDLLTRGFYMKIKFEWEIVNKGIEGGTIRAKVIGGWLVIIYEEDNHKITSKTVNFIADPAHEWEIE